jgi:two-component system sensor histidine kinase UhpB
MSIALSALTRRAPDGSDLARSLADLQGRAMQMAETLRGLSHELHPGVLRHAGIAAALQAYCGEFRAHHRIDVVFSPAPAGLEAVPPEAALCFYRVVQEALGNIAKHAGATRVDVTIGRGAGGALELGIADNGRGFDPAEARHGTGLGLVSLDERVRLAGGTIRIRSEVGKGTQLRVVIPTAATTGGLDHGTRDRLASG